jgi:hypothetical protein
MNKLSSIETILHPDPLVSGWWRLEWCRKESSSFWVIRATEGRRTKARAWFERQTMTWFNFPSGVVEFNEWCEWLATPQYGKLSPAEAILASNPMLSMVSKSAALSIDRNGNIVTSKSGKFKPHLEDAITSFAIRTRKSAEICKTAYDLSMDRAWRIGLPLERTQCLVVKPQATSFAQSYQEI